MNPANDHLFGRLTQFRRESVRLRQHLIAAVSSAPVQSFIRDGQQVIVARRGNTCGYSTPEVFRYPQLSRRSAATNPARPKTSEVPMNV